MSIFVLSSSLQNCTFVTYNGPPAAPVFYASAEQALLQLLPSCEATVPCVWFITNNLLLSGNNRLLLCSIGCKCNIGDFIRDGFTVTMNEIIIVAHGPDAAGEQAVDDVEDQAVVAAEEQAADAVASAYEEQGASNEA